MAGKETIAAEAVHGELATYHESMLAVHGSTPGGVGWNGVTAQELRFEQLARLLRGDAEFSINDLGCGYGALYDYLGRKHKSFSYRGYDVSAAMVAAASASHARAGNATFACASAPDRIADF